MSDKTFKIVTGIVGLVETVAIGIVSMIQPENMLAINGSITVVGTAIIEVCNIWKKADEKKIEKNKQL